MKRQIFVTIKTSFTLDETTKYKISVMNQSVRRGEVINSANGTGRPKTREGWVRSRPKPPRFLTPPNERLEQAEVTTNQE